jgi:hypothetical protein
LNCAPDICHSNCISLKERNSFAAVPKLPDWDL